MMPFYLPKFLVPGYSACRLPYVEMGLNIDTRDLVVSRAFARRVRVVDRQQFRFTKI